MPKLTYSGLQAAFSFDGIQVGKDQTIEITATDLKKISSGKVFKTLLESGDVSITEDSKTKSTGSKAKDDGKGEDAALVAVKADLTKLGITFADDETLEQLQAKLAQVKE